LPGIALSVMLSLILLIRRASSPYDAILGQVPGVDGFTDISEYPNAQTIPELLVYSFDAALLFFNADYFKKRVRDVVSLSAPSLRLFVFDMEAISVIDIAGLDAIEEIRSELAAKRIAFIVARAKNQIRNKLIRSGLWERIGASNFHPSVRSAVQSGSSEGFGSSATREQQAGSILKGTPLD
jgi:MFS superfamily sulfate permease-like transporter